MTKYNTTKIDSRALAQRLILIAAAGYLSSCASKPKGRVWEYLGTAKCVSDVDGIPPRALPQMPETPEMVLESITDPDRYALEHMLSKR